MRKPGLCALSSAALLLSVQAHAQDASTLADIRCVAVGMHFAETPDSHEKSTGTLLVLYYMGRLDGRAPNLDIGTLLAQQIDSMKASDYSAEATRCAQALAQRGAHTNQLGEELHNQYKF